MPASLQNIIVSKYGGSGRQRGGDARTLNCQFRVNGSLHYAYIRRPIVESINIDKFTSPRRQKLTPILLRLKIGVDQALQKYFDNLWKFQVLCF